MVFCKRWVMSRVNRLENLGLVVKMNRVKGRSRAWAGPAGSRAV